MRLCRHPLRTRALLGLALLSLAATACGSGVQTTEGGESFTTTTAGTESTASTTAPSAPAQRIDFQPCAGGECGTLTVPLDYDHPDGPTIDLAVARVPAANPAERIGVLLTNPGGPGASGVEFALAQPFPQEVLDRFDIIGWDPRGVGDTDPLQCGDTVDAFRQIDPEPDSTAEQRSLDRAARAVADECERTDGDLLPHLGTVDVVKDMDAIRQGLGEDQISYAGFSYGTALGLGYLEEFPENARAVILDGVVDPAQDLTDVLLTQDAAIEGQLNDILAQCDDDPSCPLDDAAATYDRVAAAIDAHPLPGGDGEVGPAELQTGAVYVTYQFSPGDPAALWQALADADDGDGEGIAQLAQNYYDLGAYTPYAAVECVDSPVPQGSREWKDFADEMTSQSPRTGASAANELLPCAFWGAEPSGDPHVVHAPGSPPVLVVGNTGDNATPYQQAVDAAQNLEDGHLLTLDAAGHVGAGRSQCVADAESAYLIDLTLPDDGTVCRD